MGEPTGQHGDAGSPLAGLGRRLLVPLGLGGAALLALGLAAGSRQLAARIAELDLRLVAALLALSGVNYALRFVRWQAYLRRLGIELPMASSLGVFLVGFLLSVTPGKAGELGKAWLVRELGGGAARRALSVVLAERLTDLLAVLLLAVAAAGDLAALRWLALAVLAAVLLIVTVLAMPRRLRPWLDRLARLPRAAAVARFAMSIHEALGSLLAPSPLTLGVALGVLAWAAEGLGFALLARSYGDLVPWVSGIFIYSAGTLAGALSMLPGGLLVTEGGFAVLLAARGLDRAAAASVTLVVRGATLWFAVLLGLAALPWVLGKLRHVRRAAQGSGGTK